MEKGIGSPISNEAFDVISALHKKLEGLEAFRKYAQDGQAQVWQKLSDLDQQAVSTLVDQLEQMVKDGKLRMGAPGKAGPSKSS
jgi:macrodomain Ter protein organizer (MatP/YcbG family)